MSNNSNRGKIIGGVVAGVLALGLIGMFVDDPADEPVASAPASPSPAAEEGPDLQEWADRVEAELLRALGTDDFRTYCDMPDGWVCAITGVTSDREGEATVHVQQNYDRKEATETAEKVWRLIAHELGDDLRELWVEDADGTAGVVTG